MKNLSFNVWKAGLLLIAGLILLPLLVISFQKPIAPLQLHLIKNSAWILGIAALICFIVSTITQNHSQVDKLWSIMPVVYCWYFAIESGMSIRLLCMAILATIWGVRLTYNFARRGGYNWKFWTGDEDYRWAVLRNSDAFNAKWKWILFNLLFISFYQMTLIWLFCLPAVAAAGSEGFTVLDAVLCLLFVLFVIIETIADQQQWNFQKEKYRRIRYGEPLGEYASGFVSTGLWSVVRHPNYASEQSIWIVFYAFSISATGNIVNWSILGSILLILLFQGSAQFSEGLSASKYPEYNSYMNSTGKFIPRFTFILKIFAPKQTTKFQ